MRTLLGSVIVGVIACRSAAQAPPARLLPFDVLGASAAPSTGCRAPEYHQFDFWLGNWDVYGAKGKLTGTNMVKSRLGGCVVEENWTGGTLGRGRSLNFYDASTRTWSQMWVSSGGCPTGMIMYEGTFANGSMTMRGRRESPAGYEIGPPCGPPPPVKAKAWTNIGRWSALPNGSVLQQFSAAPNDDTLPDMGPVAVGNGLRYDRVTTVTPIDSPDPSYCPNRKETTQLDFMVGSWSVRAGGGGAQGTATFSKDMQGCLIEERFTEPGGYEGMSFNAFDVFTGKWFRTYVDTDGNRLVLVGGLENGSMVLTGTKKAAGGKDVAVRITWTPEGEGRVVQRWEISRDGGRQWRTARELGYTRQ